MYAHYMHHIICSYNYVYMYVFMYGYVYTMYIHIVATCIVLMTVASSHAAPSTYTQRSGSFSNVATSLTNGHSPSEGDEPTATCTVCIHVPHPLLVKSHIRHSRTVFDEILKNGV